MTTLEEARMVSLKDKYAVKEVEAKKEDKKEDKKVVKKDVKKKK